MKRKHFITSLLASVAAVKVMGMDGKPHEPQEAGSLKIPPNLKQGDTIGITSPAGYITLEEITPAMQKIIEWGYQVVVGHTIGKRDHTFGGTDEERRADMQQMLDDKNIRAIMCARGGYGIVRIIDKLSFKKFSTNPKWIIGFSDITVMHSHIHAKYNIATLHSKMCNSFPVNWEAAELSQKATIESINMRMRGQKLKLLVTPSPHNKPGKGKGQLVGGNLKSLESLAGSKSDISTKNKILFVEDTGEYLYSLDRMFWNLKRSGKLDNLQGLIIGGFKVKADDVGEEFGKTLEQIVLEKISQYNYPVCFDFPVGHQKNNYPLKCGVVHTLDVSMEEALLSEV